MRLILTWCERLSLDAVLVALVWGFGLSGGILSVHLGLLGVATWLTYVADRLIDVRKVSSLPSTDRHRFYRAHWRTFTMFWLVLFVLSVWVAWRMLPAWKWWGGVGLVACVCLYLFCVGQLPPNRGRRLLKRIAVPLIFTFGVVWMAEAWGSPETTLLSICLFCGAVVNVLLVDQWEHQKGDRVPLLAGLRRGAMAGLGLVLATGLWLALLEVVLPASTLLICFLILGKAVHKGPRALCRSMADLALAAGGLLTWLPL